VTDRYYVGPDATGAVLSGNSSTAALNSGAVFTGSWVDVSGYDSVTTALTTDQNCTVAVQFSPDASNVDSTLTRYYVTTKINPPHRFTAMRKYVRVVVTNTSASNQTYLRLQTMAGDKQLLNTPTDSVMAQNYESIGTRPTNWHSEVSLGRRQGVVSWQKFGWNDDVDTGAQETIWSYGGLLSPLTTARTLSIVSSSANDTAAGTGLRTVLVTGIDANRLEQAETVTLNGTTPVVTSASWLGVNRVTPTSAGSGLTNAGNITATASVDLTVQAYMAAGVGTTQQSFFFTPAQTTFLADWLAMSAFRLSGGGASPRVTVRGYVRNFSTGVRYEVMRKLIDTSVTNEIQLSPKEAFVVPSSSLLEFTAETDTNNTLVSLRFAGELHDDIGT
jgi:hypothetical protein